MDRQRGGGGSSGRECGAVLCQLLPAAPGLVLRGSRFPGKLRCCTCSTTSALQQLMVELAMIIIIIIQ